LPEFGFKVEVVVIRHEVGVSKEDKLLMFD
jgi:hypothetical protein